MELIEHSRAVLVVLRLLSRSQSSQSRSWRKLDRQLPHEPLSSIEELYGQSAG